MTTYLPRTKVYWPETDNPGADWPVPPVFKMEKIVILMGTAAELADARNTRAGNLAIA